MTNKKQPDKKIKLPNGRIKQEISRYPDIRKPLESPDEDRDRIVDEDPYNNPPTNEISHQKEELKKL